MFSITPIYMCAVRFKQLYQIYLSCTAKLGCYLYHSLFEKYKWSLEPSYGEDIWQICIKECISSYIYPVVMRKIYALKYSDTILMQQ